MQGIAEGWYTEHLRPLSYVNFEINHGDVRKGGAEFNAYLQNVLKDIDNMSVSIDETNIPNSKFGGLESSSDNESDCDITPFLDHGSRVLVVGDQPKPTASTSGFTVAVYGKRKNELQDASAVGSGETKHISDIKEDARDNCIRRTERVQTDDTTEHSDDQFKYNQELSDLLEFKKSSEEIVGQGETLQKNDMTPIDVYDQQSFENYMAGL